jgi:tetratricopeptide (TPR) repeat protein
VATVKQRGEGLKSAVDGIPRALQSNPRIFSEDRSLQLELQATGFLKNLVEDYETALKENPKDAGALYFVANGLYVMQDFAAAKKHFETIVARDPKDRASFLTLIDVYQKLGEHGKVVDLLKPRVTRGQTGLGYELPLARSALAVGDYDCVILATDALITSKAKSQRAPEAADSEMYLLRGEAALAQNNRERAQIAFTRATQADPSAWQGHYGLGRLYAKSGTENDLAAKSLARAVELEPRAVAAWLELARLYEKMGQKSAALNAFKKVLEYQPEHSEAQQAVSRLGGE